MYYRISKNEKNLFFGKKIAQVWAVTLRLLEALRGMYIPTYSTEQDNIFFSIPILIAIKNHIDI